MEISGIAWAVTLIILLAMLAVDVVLVARRPHEPSMREAAIWVAVYITLALLFGLVLLWWHGARFAGEFYAGWLTEYSLSADNLFVFVIIMARFAVPRAYQQKVLLFGIVLALVLRGAFIAVGGALINQFVWVFYVFGAFLVYTAIKIARTGENDESDFRENALLRGARRLMVRRRGRAGVAAARTPGTGGTRPPAPERWAPGAPETQQARSADAVLTQPRRPVDGQAAAMTRPALIMVMIAIGTTDLIFALDSIPAIFGLTKVTYIVFTANVFALMGLRQLYFLIGKLLDRLIYLSIGLAVVLAFIGVKLVLEALHQNDLPFLNGGDPITAVPEVPIWLSLTVIVAVLGATAAASLVKSGRDRPAEPHESRASAPD